MGDLKKQIDRINYISGYVVNESPSYRPIMDDSSFDSIPEGWNMKEADAPAPTPEPNAAPPTPAPTPTPTSGSTAPASAPAEAPPIAPALPPVDAAPTPSPEAAMDSSIGSSPSPSPEMGGAMQPDKDQLQNEVMRFQLDAMKKMSQKIDQLEGIISGLNAQQAELYSEVEKVRDPSDVEKFDNRKQDSSPYYFNLNDMWNGNTFQARMDNFNSQGIVKTKDGYVADFDQLPKLSSYQVKDSFEQV